MANVFLNSEEKLYYSLILARLIIYSYNTCFSAW